MMGCSTLDIYNPPKKFLFAWNIDLTKKNLNRFQYELHEDAHIVHYKMCEFLYFYYGIYCFKM
jgi:hypothetical protein